MSTGDCSHHNRRSGSMKGNSGLCQSVPGSGTFLSQMPVTQHFPSFICFALTTCRGPFSLFYCWNGGGSTLEKPESQIWKSSFREKKVEMKSLSHVRRFVTPWTVVHGILQVRILEWVTFPFRSSQPRD